MIVRVEVPLPFEVSVTWAALAVTSAATPFDDVIAVVNETGPAYPSEARFSVTDAALPGAVDTEVRLALKV